MAEDDPKQKESEGEGAFDESDMAEDLIQEDDQLFEEVKDEGGDAIAGNDLFEDLVEEDVVTTWAPSEDTKERIKQNWQLPGLVGLVLLFFIGLWFLALKQQRKALEIQEEEWGHLSSLGDESVGDVQFYIKTRNEIGKRRAQIKAGKRHLSIEASLQNTLRTLEDRSRDEGSKLDFLIHQVTLELSRLYVERDLVDPLRLQEVVQWNRQLRHDVEKGTLMPSARRDDFDHLAAKALTRLALEHDQVDYAKEALSLRQDLVDRDVITEDPLLKARLTAIKGQPSDLEAALGVIEKALAEDSSSVIDLVELKARFLFDLHRDQDAENALMDLVAAQDDPLQKGSVLYRLAELQRRRAERATDDQQSLSKIMPAIQHFNQAAQLSDQATPIPSQATLGSLESRFLKWQWENSNQSAPLDELLRAFESSASEILAYPPLRVRARVGAARVAMRLNDIDRAIENLEKSVSRQNRPFLTGISDVTRTHLIETLRQAAQAKEKQGDFQTAIEALENVRWVLNKRDKKGFVDLHYQIAHFEDSMGEVEPDAEKARAAFRRAALMFLDLRDEKHGFTLNRRENGDVLWNAYLEYRKCYDTLHLERWKVPEDSHDLEKAIHVLNDLEKVSLNPRYNEHITQVMYDKGLLQRRLQRLDDAISSFDKGRSIKEWGGDDLYIYRSLLELARTYQRRGSEKDLDQAENIYGELLVDPALSPDAEPWREGLFSLGFMMAHRSRVATDDKTKSRHTIKASRILNEAVQRYPQDVRVFDALYAEGFSKWELAHIQKNDAFAFFKQAISAFEKMDERVGDSELSKQDEARYKNALMGLGSSYMSLGGRGALEKGIEVYRKVARRYRRDPVESEAYFGIFQATQSLALREKESIRLGSGDQGKLDLYSGMMEEYHAKWLRASQETRRPSEYEINKFGASYWDDLDRRVADLLERVGKDNKESDRP